ncbi:ABC transporter substrate-binding protein [Variovorax sp. KK3]|uniref:ABC transporter substrate-binding protein n=1 Tax=Variovorax sp. KK3 TaxID=1855728 RepID=UPI00097C4D35|nr:ABC transporter substrate-binding protein [Variovorax sp. KK3]
MLSRRAAITTLTMLAAASRAQQRPQKSNARLAFLGGAISEPATVQAQVGSMRQGLRDLGWVEGRNLGIDARWAEARYERLPGLLDELLRLDPDVLVTSGPRPAMVAKDKVKSLPVVVVNIDDPVQMGLITSHTRPGGNMTGVTAAFRGIFPKRLQLLKDVVPAARRFAILFNPDTLPRQNLVQDVPSWEQSLGITFQLLEMRGPEDVEPAFAAMAREGADAIVLVADAMVWTQRARITAMCLEQRLPSAWGGGGYLDAGGLLSYQGDFPALYRRAAVLVDKILRGTPPGEIPFEQGTKLELVVNLKGARALGITIPQSVLVSADEVIE